MLTIRDAQMAVFEQYVEEQFKQRLGDHLGPFLAEKGIVIGAEALRAEIDRGLAQCGEFGLDRQCDIARYFEIVCGSAGGFTAGPLPKDALNILYAYRVDPELKLGRLQAWADRRREEQR
jgi:hypothetical protein